MEENDVLAVGMSSRFRFFLISDEYSDAYSFGLTSAGSTWKILDFSWASQMAVQTASPVQPHHVWSISSTSLLDLMPIVLWHQNLQITGSWSSN